LVRSTECDRGILLAHVDDETSAAFIAALRKHRHQEREARNRCEPALRSQCAIELNFARWFEKLLRRHCIASLQFTPDCDDQRHFKWRRVMNTRIRKETSTTDANRDPISGAPGAHPIGTGLGAAGGGIAAGALAGTVAGPIGTIVGAAIGAVAGGLAGKGIAEAIDPTAEEAYWRGKFADRPYVQGGSKFDDYGPAYRHGADAYGRSKGRSFDDAEPELKRDWERVRGKSRLSWDHAKDATRDAWQRVSDAAESAVPGDSDRDGK
jgi:hypothetical protein